MQSMTGYGRAESASQAPRCTVECASVNRKGLEVACQLPRELSALEVRIRERVAARIARGRVNVVVQFPSTATAPPINVDRVFARELLDDLRRAQAELGLSGEIPLATLAAIPGFFRSVEHATMDSWPALEDALASALDALIAMRATEGRNLHRDLSQRLNTLESLTAQMTHHSPSVVSAYREALQQRIKRANLGAPVDEARLAAEIVLFAERSDVSEELTRLASHFGQFREKLDDTNPVGRALEFLTQEIFRELNTLGAKAGDGALSRLVMDAKVELDKMREQILNVE